MCADVVRRTVSSIRSNLQNPIKRWNLVSNDDFQNELSRFFWAKRLYYERRQCEWKYRKLELCGVGIARGPDIRWMTQLIAASHYDKKKLGPAVAQGRLNELFDEDAYSVIRNTPPTTAYQLYLVAEILDRCLRRLSNKKQYIRNLKGYVNLCAFSLLNRILKEAHVPLGRETMEARFEQIHKDDAREWEIATKALVDYIVVAFKRASAREWREEGNRLTPANYFKNLAMISDLIKRPIPQQLCRISKLVAS